MQQNVAHRLTLRKVCNVEHRGGKPTPAILGGILLLSHAILFHKLS